MQEGKWGRFLWSRLQIYFLNLPSSKQGPLNSSFEGEGEDIDADFEIVDDLYDIQDEDITDMYMQMIIGCSDEDLNFVYIK